MRMLPSSTSGCEAKPPVFVKTVLQQAETDRLIIPNPL